MAFTIKHAKTNNIPAWTQVDLNSAIAAGFFPIGTVLADITLSTDWNSNHTFAAPGITAGWVLTADGSGSVDFAAPSTSSVLTDTTLTGSGTLASPLGLALNHANTWTVPQTFSAGVITPKIYPASNSTTAVQVLKADGTTVLVNVDTSNGFTTFGPVVAAFTADGANSVMINSSAPEFYFYRNTNAANVKAYGIYIDSSGQLTFNTRNDANTSGLNAPVVFNRTGGIAITNDGSVTADNTFLIRTNAGTIGPSVRFTSFEGADYLMTATGSGNTGGVGAWRIFDFTALVNRIWITPAGNVGIGIDASAAAKLHLLKTTEQLRVGYDVSNYYSTTVSSTGGVTFDAIGSGTSFTFKDDVKLDVVGTALYIKEGTNGFMGQVTLVSGVSAITITGLTTSDRAFVQTAVFGVAIGSGGHKAVCTANTLTITSIATTGTTNTLDTSTINYVIFRPA